MCNKDYSLSAPAPVTVTVTGGSFSQPMLLPHAQAVWIVLTWNAWGPLMIHGDIGAVTGAATAPVGFISIHGIPCQVAQVTANR